MLYMSVKSNLQQNCSDNETFQWDGNLEIYCFKSISIILNLTSGKVHNRITQLIFSQNF